MVPTFLRDALADLELDGHCGKAFGFLRQGLVRRIAEQGERGADHLPVALGAEQPAQDSRLAGADRIILITRQLSRREAALRLGATLALDPTATDAVAAVRDATGGGVDVVIECAGVPETLQTGVRMARRGGVFVLFGVTPAGLEVPVLPFDLLVNEVEIRPAYLNPFTHSRAAAMVASGILELDSLVTKTIGLEEVASVVGSAPLAGEIKVIVRP